MNWRQYNKILFAPMRRASRDYGLIEENDKIAIGLSGGKDSTTLLWALTILKRTLPTPFELQAITFDMGLGCDYSPLVEFCDQLDVPLHIEPSNAGEIIFEERKEKNPCSLCARMRRGAVNGLASKMGCNKVALGHHLDDVLETFLLAMFYEGRLHTFAPKVYLDRQDVTVIRPFIYIPESTIKKIIAKENFPIIENPCPANGITKREEEKNLIAQLAKTNPAVRQRMLTAIENGIWQKNNND